MASNQTAMDALINEMDRDVEYQERYNALKTLIDQARERQDIPEYKRLYKELTGQLNKKHTSNKIKRHTNKHRGKPIYFPCSEKQSPDQTKSRVHQIMFR